MGIQNLFRLIKEFAPGSISVMSIDDFAGWRIGIDASIAIHQWYHIGQSKKVVNRDNTHINHIQGALFRTINMITNDIMPIYIFDGKAPAAKSKTISLRSKSSTRIPSKIFNDVAMLLGKLGVGVMRSPGEAEAQAAYLTKIGDLDAVATEDMDALAFGAKLMIRGLNVSAKNIILIDRAKVLSELGISDESFIDLCILLGCDYTGKLPGVGYKRALKFIKKYKSIENIIAKEDVESKYCDYLLARAEFMNPIIKEGSVIVRACAFDASDIAQLRAFLMGHGLPTSRTHLSIQKLIEYYHI